MSLDTLDVARAQYIWALHRARPELDDQVRDLAKVFGSLMAARAQQGPGAPAPTTGAEPPYLHLLPPDHPAA